MAALAPPAAAALFSSAASSASAGPTSYENPLVGRYSSEEMNYNWSPAKKFTTWRKLWAALARAQHELGLDVTAEQVAELEAHIEDIDYEAAKAKEKEIKHDVMAHIYAYGLAAPTAAPIIHLGATSCFVGDNTDLIQMRDGMRLLQAQLLDLISVVRDNALKYAHIPTLGFTHYQPAQMTTVGKRMALWLQDFVMDYHELAYLAHTLPFRGVKGTTGTQASFLELFGGDSAKVRELDRRVTQLAGFPRSIGVSGQTYTRKLDFMVLSRLSAIAQSAHKMAVDIRLLSNLKEMEEPWGKKQVGSSAMPYKQNPMRSERICSLARHVMVNIDNTAHTAANQWLERTLDDSANRRLVLPEAFLAVDVILSVSRNVMDGIQVHPKVIEKRIAAELPFMASENILMAGVKAGGSRQELHEVIRELALEAAEQVKVHGKDNDLMDRIAAHPAFSALSGEQLDAVLDPAQYVGRAPNQVAEYIAEEVDPLLESQSHVLEKLSTDRGMGV
ncbi:adenylosuccinate lyase, partial [Thecamonas trahens ATCC 50062]